MHPNQHNKKRSILGVFCLSVVLLISCFAYSAYQDKKANTFVTDLYTGYLTLTETDGTNITDSIKERYADSYEIKDYATIYQNIKALDFHYVYDANGDKVSLQTK